MAWLKQDSTAEWEMKETKRVSKFILQKKKWQSFEKFTAGF